MSGEIQAQVFKAGSTTYFNSSLFFPPAMRAERTSSSTVRP